MEWRDIPGHEGRYQLSSDGQARSLPRYAHDRHLAGTSLDTSRGYVTVSRGGKVTRLNIARLLHKVFPEIHPDPQEVKPGEDWRDVPGYEGIYRVSQHGDVRRVSSGRILKVGANGCVGLSKPGEKVWFVQPWKLLKMVFEGVDPSHYIAPGKTAEEMRPYRDLVSRWIARNPTKKAKKNREKLVKLYYEYRGQHRSSKDFRYMREALTEHQF